MKEEFNKFHLAKKKKKRMGNTLMTAIKNLFSQTNDFALTRYV